MKRKAYLPLFLIIGLLLLLMSLPQTWTQKIRGNTIALLAPLWEREKATGDGKEEVFQLRIENQLLRNEVKRTQELLKEAFYSNLEWQKFTANDPSQDLPAAARRHLKDLGKILQMRVEAIPARVIYRPSVFWNSTLWVDVGTSTNSLLGREIVTKNSPVVLGNSLVGIVDYVGKKQSRVRLITDSRLPLSVRAARGNPQGRRLSEALHSVLDNLMEREDLFANAQKKEKFFQALAELQKKLEKEKNSWFLAKGELQGSSAPIWRARSHFLKGTGFNYDFADEMGPARDLYTGVPYPAGKIAEAIPLLQAHDILLTTGMDGVFPPGLQVAEVLRVAELKEGDYYYDLIAFPTAGNLDELSLLFIMPPLGYDPADAPSK